MPAEIAELSETLVSATASFLRSAQCSEFDRMLMRIRFHAKLMELDPTPENIGKCFRVMAWIAGDVLG